MHLPSVDPRAAQFGLPMVRLGCAFCVLRTRAAECGLSIARIDSQITMRPVGLTERTMISRSMDGPLYGECSICAL